MPLDFYQIIGHRGLAAKAPENTLASIKMAASMGLKWVEFDVNTTQDNIAVLCHDNTVNRTTNSKGRVSRMDFATISQLDAGSWFDPLFKQEKIPTLLQALKLCQQLKLGVNLELKPDSRITDAQIHHYINTVTTIILPFKNSIPLLVSSFNKDVIRAFKQSLSDIPLGFLLDRHETERSLTTFAHEINCYSFHLSMKQCRRFKSYLLAQFNKPLLVYTINNPLQACELLESNVTAIFSDSLTPDSLSIKG